MATLETEDLATDVDLVITDQGNPAKALPYLEDYLHTIKQDLEALNDALLDDGTVLGSLLAWGATEWEELSEVTFSWALGVLTAQVENELGVLQTMLEVDATASNKSLAISGGVDVDGLVQLPGQSGNGLLIGSLDDYGWHDMLGPVQARGAGPTDPGWNQINTSGFYAFEFTLNDEVWINYHLPHDYALGTDIYFHAHWLPDGTDSNSVKWQFSYVYADGHDQAAFPMGSASVITAEQVVGGTQYQHYVTETVAITIADMEPDGMIQLHVERITNGATDNADGIFLLTCDIHYQSTGIPTVNRAPNFYDT